MYPANITRDEAHARSQLLSTSRYRVTVDLTGSPSTFTSTSTISFSSTAGTTFVDLIADSIVEATLDDAPLDFSAYNGERVPLDLTIGDHVLAITAVCRYSNTGEGLHRFVDPVCIIARSVCIQHRHGLTQPRDIVAQFRDGVVRVGVRRRHRVTRDVTHEFALRAPLRVAFCTGLLARSQHFTDGDVRDASFPRYARPDAVRSVVPARSFADVRQKLHDPSPREAHSVFRDRNVPLLALVVDHSPRIAHVSSEHAQQTTSLRERASSALMPHIV